MEHAKIVAVDFDGCIVTNKWPEIGEPVQETISQYIKERKVGTKFILWTCRTGQLLDDAVQWCNEHGITFDAVNEPLPELLELFVDNPRKIFANEYWDDRSVCMPHSVMDYNLRHIVFYEVEEELKLNDIRCRLNEIDEELLHGRCLKELYDDEKFLIDVLRRWEKSESWIDNDVRCDMCYDAIKEVLEKWDD